MSTNITESESSTTLPSEELAPENNYFLGVLNFIVGVLVMASNGVVLFVILKTKALRQPTLWVICHMAFWDFVMGLFNLVILLPSAMLNRFAFPEKYMGIVACFITYLVSVIFLNVATIVIDRLISLKFPHAYAKMKKRTYVFAVIVVHALAVSRMLLISFPDMDFYYNKVAAMPMSDYGNFRETLFSLGFIAATLIMIIVCSSLIVNTVKQRRRQTGERTTNIISGNNIKLSMMTVVSAAVFCISFVPLVTAICWNLSVGHSKVPNWLVQVMIFCILSNSIWNVLIYAATYRPFREPLIYIFCRKYYRTMLRKRQGIVSPVQMTPASRPGKMETTSPDALVSKPSTSCQLQVPTQLFLTSSGT